MVITQSRSHRQETGALYKDYRKKKLHEKGNRPILTKVGKTKQKTVRTKGGGLKQKLLTVDVANVLDKKTKKLFKAKILSVVETPANRNFVRRSIMTKGVVIETDKGKARITSRPGQEGAVNAVLI